MEYIYEKTQGNGGLPVKTIIHAIDGFQMHWHNAGEPVTLSDGETNILGQT